MSSPTESTYFRLNRGQQVLIVRISRKRITDEDNVDQFGESLADLVDNEGVRRMLMDVEELEYVTSSVLGKLILVHRKLDRVGGLLVFCNVGPDLDEILEATRLTTLFHIAPDAEAGRAMLERV